ncbi:glycosyltransferase family 2 protein [Spirillospora sp. NPDC049652]
MTPVDVVLPCLNEADALPWVLDRMPSGYVPIVVDNGSTDASAEIAARHGARVVHAPRRGFGEACHTGLLAATAETVCFMDADASLDPRDLPLLVTALPSSTAASASGPVSRPTLVLGRRRPTEWRSWPPHARVANRVLARELNRRARTSLHDLGPMRAARRADLLALALADRRFGYPLEMVLKAARANWRITELDVPYRPRTGRSKVTGSVRGTIRAVHDMRHVLATVGAA